MTVSGSDEQGPAVSAPGQVPTEQIRSSDAERNAVADRLHTALAEGRLDVTETE